MKTVMLIGKYLSLFVAQRLLMVDVLSQLFLVKGYNQEADASDGEQEIKQNDAPRNSSTTSGTCATLLNRCRCRRRHARNSNFES